MFGRDDQCNNMSGRRRGRPGNSKEPLYAAGIVLDNGVLRCNFCDGVFFSQSSIYNHIRLSHGEHTAIEEEHVQHGPTDQGDVPVRETAEVDLLARDEVPPTTQVDQVGDLVYEQGGGGLAEVDLPAEEADDVLGQAMEGEVELPTEMGQAFVQEGEEDEDEDVEEDEFLDPLSDFEDEEPEEEEAEDEQQEEEAAIPTKKLGKLASWFSSRLGKPVYSISRWWLTSVNGSSDSDTDSSMDISRSGSSIDVSNVSSGASSSQMEDSNMEDSNNNSVEDILHARVSMVETINFFLTLKQKHRIGKSAFNELLLFLSNHLLPEGNILPPSLHLMREVVAYKFSSYESRACV